MTGFPADDTFAWAGGIGSFIDPDQWIDLTTSNTGTFVPGSGATVTLTSGGITDSGTAATITVTGAMSLQGQVGGPQVSNGGTVTLSGTASEFGGTVVDNQGAIGGDGTLSGVSITNDGSIGAGQLQGSSLDNTGTVSVVGMSLDTLDNRASVAVSGNAGVQDVINAGSMNLGGGAQVSFGTLTNSGTLTVGDGSDLNVTVSADISGSIVASGTTDAPFFAALATIEAGGVVQGSNLRFSAGTLVVDGGGRLDAGGVAIGGTIVAGGSVVSGNLGGSLAALTLAGALQANGFLNFSNAVSVTASGSVSVSGGGGVNVGAAGTLDIAGRVDTDSSDVADDGLVDLHGAGALFTNSQQLTVGLNSPGTFEVSNGASASATDVIFGGRALVSGLGIVDGAIWGNNGFVEIGSLADGTLRVANGGTFTAGSGVSVSNSGVTGTLTIDGAGSFLQAGGLEVNEAGTVIATNGASLSTGADSLALFPSGSIAATVELQSGAIWTSATTIGVGLGTINVAGGTLASAVVEIGSGGTNVTASLLSVTGADSRWTNTGSIVVGVDASGTLALASAATLDAPGDVIAGATTNGDGTITDDGPGTRLSVAGDLIIGRAGAGFFSAANSASLRVGGTLHVGGSLGIGTVIDTGAGARHFGALAIDNGAVTVEHGIGNAWIVDQGDGQNIDIGGVAGGTATLGVAAVGTIIAGVGTVTVGGAGTGTLTLAESARFDATANDMTVGDASAANGSVSVNGATLAAGNLTVGAGGTAEVTVNADGTLTTGTLAIGSKSGGAGAVDVNASATLTGRSISVGSGGTAALHLTGARVITTGDVGIASESQAAVQTVTADAQAQWTVGGLFSVGAAGTAVATIAGGSLLTVNSDVAIGATAGANGALTVTGAGSMLQGDTLAVGGVADAAGGTGTLDIASGGTVLVAAALVWPSGRISVGGSLEVQGNISGDGTVVMAGGVLHLDAPGSVSASVSDFSPGDTIDLKGVTPDSVQLVSGILLFDGGAFALDAPGGEIQVAASSDGAAVTACFAAGTRILTDAGELPVEALRPGMRAVSIPHRRKVTIARVGRQRSHAAPVRIAAGGLGRGVPHRDLFLSPDHAVFVAGVLIPIRYLINGASVAPAARGAVTYYHLELATHGVVIAEGLAAESFLNTGNRDLLAPPPLHTELSRTAIAEPARRHSSARILQLQRGAHHHGENDHGQQHR